MRQPGDQQADRDIFNIDNKGTVTVINQPVPQRSRSESLLLQAVKQEVISRLDQSLHSAVFINLDKQPQPQQVKRPWDAEIKIGSKSPEPLPAETTILEVFDRSGIDGRLLILGEPGAGKTTTMLDLAKGLCDRAEQDATKFIPVLLNLSSWQDPKQTMTAWLVEELKSKYGVRKDIGTQWLAEKQLLPLLDGLDEVKPEHQESCVQAINRWLESDDRPPSLAVCCRREEYEKVVRGRWQADAEEPQDETRIHLNGAILLQTLTDEQIQTYLTAVNQPELWQMLQQDEELWKLIKTPLWLSITLLSYEGLSLKQWEQTTSIEQRLALLLDAYTERMLCRKLNNQIYGKRKPPNAKQTRRWLVFLATQLEHESQTEFLIEKMQPTWLLARDRQAYKLGFWLFLGLVSGLVLGLVFSVGLWLVEMLIFGLDSALKYGFGSGLCGLGKRLVSELIFELLGGLVTGLVLGILGGVFGFLISWLVGQPGKIRVVEVIQFSFLNSARKILGFVFFGLLSGLINGVGFGLELGLFGGLFGGLILGLLGGLFFGLVGGLLNGSIRLERLEVNIKSSPNQGVWKSARTAVLIALVFGSFFGLFSGLFSTPSTNVGHVRVELVPILESSELYRRLYTGLPTVLVPGSFSGLFGGLFFGGTACIKHFVLRLILWRRNHAPWNYARFLDYGTDRLLLQRVGGRYRFIHKSLQEHFAAMRE